MSVRTTQPGCGTHAKRMLRFLLNEALNDPRKERQTIVSSRFVWGGREASSQSPRWQIGLMGATHGIVKARRSTSSATKTTLTAVRAAAAAAVAFGSVMMAVKRCWRGLQASKRA